MKKLIPILVFSLFFFINNAFSQSPYFFKTTDVLKVEKEAALKSSQYTVSNEITKELTLRNEAQAKIDLLQSDINKKLEIEDYEAAQALKEQMDKLKADQAKAEDLRKKIEAALAIEDYEKADQYKTALLGLGNPSNVAATQQTQVSQPANTNTNSSQALINSLSAVGAVNNNSGFASNSQPPPPPKKQQNSYTGRSKFFARRGMSLEAAMAITNAKGGYYTYSTQPFDAGISYFVNWRFYRNLANFGDKGGMLLHFNLGYLPYSFSNGSAKFYYHYLSYGVGVKFHVVGLSASFGYFIDLMLDYYQYGYDYDTYYTDPGILNSGFVYRLAYETGRVEFFFEHRFGSISEDFFDDDEMRVNNLNAMIIGIALKMGKRRVVK